MKKVFQALNDHPDILDYWIDCGQPGIFNFTIDSRTKHGRLTSQIDISIQALVYGVEIEKHVIHQFESGVKVAIQKKENELRPS